MTGALPLRNIVCMRTHRPPRTILTGAALIPLVALAIAGCGGDDNDNQATAATPKASGGSAATVGVAASSLGKILTDSKGRTIYLFAQDTGTKSTCSGACAAQWPPVTSTGKPAPEAGLTASKLGTTKRSDGSRQVTYNGHPLYLYRGDESPGDVNGQGINAFGAAWYVVSPAGAPITSSSGGNHRGY
jgi:predicted lipoprotein with Yx(FWY)xxD motif